MLPFNMNDALRPMDATEGVNVALDTRLDNRVLDLRVRPSGHCPRWNPSLTSLARASQTTTNQAIFKIQSGVGNLFREFLNSQGFVEIHTPKLQSAATESGASVFRVSYFKSGSAPLVSPFF